MDHFTVLMLLLIVAFTLLSGSRGCGPGYKIVKFLHVSDIHLDPFYNPSKDVDTYCHSFEGSNDTADYKAPYGRIGCDSPELLWESTLSAMKEKGEGAKFIILSGDSAAHGLTDDQGSPNVLKAMSMVSSKAHEVFADIPIFPAFGNNDLPGHYILPNNSDWYKTVLSYWAPLILCSECPESVHRPTTLEASTKTFLDGGYYSVEIADGQMILLVVNAMYWNNNWYTTPLVDKIAENQFVWFENQLQLAKDQGKKVVIMSHIPPGGDPHSYQYYWIPKHLRRYVSLTAGKYHDTITGQFYAHTHRNDFHLQILDAGDAQAERTSTKSFIVQTASVSPVYSNNPTFKVFSLNTDIQALVEYDQYYLDLVIATEFSNPLWQYDYTFSKRYPSNNPLIDANRIDELNQQLISQTNSTYWNHYIRATTSNYQTASYNRFPLYCIMRYVFEEDFKKCHEKFKVTGG